MKVLFDEHKVIISAIDIAKKVNNKLMVTNEIKYENIIRQLILFFRLYADGYHHYKEEEILFPEMTKRNELLKEGVIKEMLDNHKEFRLILTSIETFLDKKDYLGASQRLNQYSEMLLNHIAVENDELFQMGKTLFSEDEITKICFRFEDYDREFGELQKNKLTNQLKEIKNQFQ